VFRLHILDIYMYILVATLVMVAENHTDDTDAKWARRLLKTWGGDAGYNRIIGAAVVGDAMVAGQKLIRFAERASDDTALTPAAAAQHLSQLHTLLKEGAIFLDAAEGTLTHAALKYMAGKLVFYRGASRRSAVCLSWPAPDSMGLAEPVNRAREFYELYEAYFNATFPGFADNNLFAAFDLENHLSLEQRKELFLSLGARHGVNGVAAWRAIAGPGDRIESGLLARAM